MSSRKTPTLTPFQRDIIKRAQASLALEGCSVSDEEALAIGQEFFGSGEAKIVEQKASALRTRLGALAVSNAVANTALPKISPSEKRPSRPRSEPKFPKIHARRR